MRHAAGSGAQPDEGGTPDGAHFLDTSWQQHTMGPAGTSGTSGASGPPGPPGAFDAATTPVPADWYQRDQQSVPTSTPEAAAAPARPTRTDEPEPPRRGRRKLVVWSLAGALVLAGAGAGAVLFLGSGDDNDKKDRAGSVGADLTPGATTAASTPPAAATTAPPTGAPSSSRPPSSSKPPSSSSSASSTAKAPANDVDAPKDPSALKPAAYAAWKRIDAAMAAEGIKLNLNSGKRGWAHQQRLLDDKIAEVGSRQEALRWVLPPEKSMHVQGVAVDIYPANAQAWLQAKGSKYGWCRMYDNEAWHFEYNASYTSGCPKRLPSALDS
ncbi:D-alanyl-D-alanine carboxypeptidase family protein [Embleya sp. NPDC050154]|uniref:D-alanyl-D-alanine carboxypeptidase family protein n=1 Tax=Embleya sp. NPDC050154 TaxID=3363988 RepID=UPI0037A3E4D5